MKRYQLNSTAAWISIRQFLFSITLILLILTLNASIFKTQSSPVDIVRKSRDVVRVSAFETISKLTITDKSGNKRIRRSTMASKNYPGGTEKRIIKFLSPPEIRGTGLLIFDYEGKDDDMWIYLPALRKTRRIVNREKSRSFMGSEFSNADMTAPSLSDFTYTLLGEDLYNGISCWKIRATASSLELSDLYGYESRVIWIEKESYLVRKTWYFSDKGEHFKTIVNNSYHLVDPVKNKYMVISMQVVNHFSGRSSEMVMEKVALADSKDEYFTIRYLEK